MIQERVRAGLARAKSEEKRLGRPPIPAEKERAIRDALNGPGRTEGVRKIAARFGVDPQLRSADQPPFAPQAPPCEPRKSPPLAMLKASVSVCLFTLPVQSWSALAPILSMHADVPAQQPWKPFKAIAKLDALVGFCGPTCPPSLRFRHMNHDLAVFTRTFSTASNHSGSRAARFAVGARRPLLNVIGCRPRPCSTARICGGSRSRSANGEAFARLTPERHTQ
jgi:hypothetical protein